ncbi:MAG: FAD-dependent oxidoreductase [Bacteroidales bacterium]|jgi:glycine/D-amino acid oxidase-like deaminating enzyme/Fe-S-cluster-containing hydrogenase component 2|nr:FAD-dependent oxidoreductase [Bacteroidales bacterium]
MNKLEQHPILDIPKTEEHAFIFNDQKVVGYKGYTIAAALHQAGKPIHSHSHNQRERSLACGIGKCGACEMLVDGKVKRICITKVDGVKEVRELPQEYMPAVEPAVSQKTVKIYKTQVCIIGAGPAGLACREELNRYNIANVVIDNNDRIGGQFNMQTHQFFFFEKEQKYGAMRGFDIAAMLAGDDHAGIILNATVWDILEGKRVAVKNLTDDSLFYVDAEYLVVATGAVPFMPSFENDDLPGVYTAAVVQKMMNVEHTLLGKRILSVGAGNIGYLTSYQAFQAGAQVVAILEAMDREGGFPVQANRVRRLAIPILTSHILVKAVPNADHTAITGAVIAECKNFKPVSGTEKLIDNIDIINICTGLIPDDQLLTKGKIVFGANVIGAGDAIRVGEGTCAVLKGKQAAMEIAMQYKKRVNYSDYLSLSKEYIESQQHPVEILKEVAHPDAKRAQKPYVVVNCRYGFACNPCSFACAYGAITKNSTSSTPVIDYDKCIGCMKCVSKCPGLAIFGYNLVRNSVVLPFEYNAVEKSEVYLVDDQGAIMGEGIIANILKNPNKTHVARIQANNMPVEKLATVTGFIAKENYPEKLALKPLTQPLAHGDRYVCHCEDIDIETIIKQIGNRKQISIDELKHTTRIAMGACRGKRCIPRVRQLLSGYGIEMTGDATPRGPMSNQLNFNELYPSEKASEFIVNMGKGVKKVECEVFVAGGGITGTALFRYFAESGKKVVMVNAERGSSWRNIGGGRPAFSVPEISDIANRNLEIFKEIHAVTDIHYKPIRYVGFAHDEATYKALEASLGWSEGYMVDKKDFRKEVSPYFNENLNTYQAACITYNCWQAMPGLLLDYLRIAGLQHGGTLLEDCRLVEVQKTANGYMALVYNHDREYVEYHCRHFVNALGANAHKFAMQLGIETGTFPVKHQAFITRPLPLIGKAGDALDMLIDRRHYKGFSAVYGQQFAATGHIIGCASPNDNIESNQELKYNSKEFLEIVAEIFSSWLPMLGSVTMQATWSGYYLESRYVVDPEHGLLIGMRGHGFMLGQYLAKIYVDKYLGKEVPAYMSRLALSGDGLSETAFK